MLRTYNIRKFIRVIFFTSKEKSTQIAICPFNCLEFSAPNVLVIVSALSILKLMWNEYYATVRTPMKLFNVPNRRIFHDQQKNFQENVWYDFMSSNCWCFANSVNIISQKDTNRTVHYNSVLVWGNNLKGIILYTESSETSYKVNSFHFIWGGNWVECNKIIFVLKIPFPNLHFMQYKLKYTSKVQWLLLYEKFRSNWNRE